MAWTLDMWFIDLDGSGDSTLIVATDYGAGGGAVAQVRSALIDGGRAMSSQFVHALVVACEVNTLDVMVATHYDDDHIKGLTALLAGGNPTYHPTRIYDQGEPGTVTASSIKRRATSHLAGTNVVNVDFANRDPNYTAYLAAIVAYGARVRVTEKVLSQGNNTPDLESRGWLNADWLVGREILWDGVPTGVPAGAPTLRCIAANQHLAQVGGGTEYVSSSELTGDTQKNQKSLACLLTFGNFKFYMGGDIEATQEDGSAWKAGGYTVDNTSRGRSLMRILNPTNDLAGRVHAMKASHHGSKESSSPDFLRRLRSRVAIISCGTNNQFSHPDQPVVDAMEAVPEVVNYFLTGDDLGPAAAHLTAKAIVAGERATPKSGDIRLSVTVAQAAAAADVVPFRVRCYRSNAGTNLAKDPNFAYAPGQFVTFNY